MEGWIRRTKFLLQWRGPWGWFIANLPHPSLMQVLCYHELVGIPLLQAAAAGRSDLVEELLRFCPQQQVRGHGPMHWRRCTSCRLSIFPVVHL